MPHDLWVVVSTTFLICVVEMYTRKDPLRPVDFVECIKIGTEVISAYGNVGLSWGLAGTTSR